MTTDGGGWTLLTWSAISTPTGNGMPYPGLVHCPAFNCARGSSASMADMPALIHTGGEKLLPVQREACRAAFGITPRDVYGASESILIGAETFYEDGLVVFADWNILETLDTAGQPSFTARA